ncbi:MAG: ATP-binding protein [Solirubrobacteraceae bacterium]
MTAADELERDYTLSRQAGWLARVQSPSRSTPARYTREQLDALDAVERRRYDEQRAVWHANLGPIVTPQLQTLFCELDQIVGSNRQDGDRVRGAAVLSALPGLGKTTAAVCYGVRYHREQLELYGDRTVQGDLRVPVVYLALTSSTTMRSLNAALCRFFDHPGWAKGNASLLADRATDCVLSCQTRLIIIDDVHFLDMGRRDGREVANHFKWLQTQFPVTFLFVGVGIAERQMGTEGLAPADAALAQTVRRWTTLSLSPFEIQTAQGRRTWRRLLLAIERDLVLADAQRGMLAERLADYLYARSTGHFASLTTLIARGCWRAIHTGAEQLTAELLDQVRNDQAAEHARQELASAFERGLLTTRATEPGTGATEARAA